MAMMDECCYCGRNLPAWKMYRVSGTPFYYCASCHALLEIASPYECTIKELRRRNFYRWLVLTGRLSEWPVDKVASAVLNYK